MIEMTDMAKAWSAVVAEKNSEITRLREDLSAVALEYSTKFFDQGAEIASLRVERDQLLACCNAARIILKNRDQRPNEVKVYEAICAAIAAVEDRHDS